MVDQPAVSPQTSLPTGRIKYSISNHNMLFDFCRHSLGFPVTYEVTVFAMTL